MDDVMSKLDAYFNDLKLRGEKIPTCSMTKEPHFRAISAGSGVSVSSLRVEPYRQRIIIATKEIGFSPRVETFASERAALFEKNWRCLSNYLKWLKNNGYKLPEDPRHRGKILREQVVLEAGLSPGALYTFKNRAEDSYRAKLLRMVDESRASLGSEVRILPQSPGSQNASPTYQQLLEKGSEERRKELHGKPYAAQQLYNTRSALNRFRKALKLDETAPVGHEFAAAFEKAVEKVTGGIPSKSSRKKFQTEILWWRACYGRLRKEPAIPGELRQAIVQLYDRSGLSLNVLSKLIGVGYASLKGWCQGTWTPSAISIEPLSRMEDLFKLPAGILTDKVPGTHSKRFRLSQLPLFLQKDLALFYKVSHHLPDNFCTLPLKKQEAIVESICTDILRGDDDYAKRLRILSRLPYRLQKKKWPEPVTVEFDTYAGFKMAENPPRGMKRRGRWRSSTKEKCENNFASLFGAICLPPDAEDDRVRGLGFPNSQLTLALIVCPEIVRWYIKFRCEVRSQYTEYPIGQLRDFRSMLQPETGWLRQSPHLAARLRPFADAETDYIPAEMVSRARDDWDGVCDDALGEYKILISEIVPRVTVARDSFHPIEGLLDRDDPMEPLGYLIEEMRRDLPNPHTKPVFYHTGIRNLSLIILEVLTGLRRTTLVKLDHTGDESGHLYMEGGKWILHVPRGFFKNENSPFFLVNRIREDYRNVLPDIFGLYATLNEYLEVSRPFLMNRYHSRSREQALFIKSSGTGPVESEPATARLSAKQASATYANKVEIYLVENKHRGTGIAKVRKTGMHSVRHLRCMTAIRETGSFMLGGDSIQITEKTALKHYSRRTTAERNLEVNQILFRRLNVRAVDLRIGPRGRSGIDCPTSA
jgi:hypothetical protein